MANIKEAGQRELAMIRDFGKLLKFFQSEQAESWKYGIMLGVTVQRALIEGEKTIRVSASSWMINQTSDNDYFQFIEYMSEEKMFQELRDYKAFMAHLKLNYKINKK